ncbi:putative membrane protein [Paenibacillus rhizosphaerae]|uniref:Putative membrane protein n=1 Tax=Paenibacillus rhizosphaerae TaxID=297318 RepID=A0A839TMC7_9BACL|nr:cytochrome c oxidase assembly protein [Paenibacillus rhizosphaerae]MBB3126548.1 putative membrane protein [Paenibacillus rhizosphaerae]
MNMTGHRGDHAGHSAGGPHDTLLIILFLVLIGLYTMAVKASNRRFRRWPAMRTICWFLGVLAAAAALTGPLAARAHEDFVYHMLGHLLLGMLSPLLIACSAPMTLLLRSLTISSARRLSAWLKSRPMRLLSHPVTASVLNVGGLWMLYYSGLYSAMQYQLVLHVLVHAHMFAAGYLYAAALLCMDPSPHRAGYGFRAGILVLSLAGHGILAKVLYAFPPGGIPLAQAESGAQLMYYGGDAVDLILIFLFCLQWYKSARPDNKHKTASSPAIS